MPKKSPVVLPWHRVGAYFNVDPFLAMGRLLEGKWTKSEEDLDSDGSAKITITRTRDEKGRVVKIERENTRDTSQNKTATLTYDELGRVVTYVVQDTRPFEQSYQYDSRDRLKAETGVFTDLHGKKHTSVATHTYVNAVIFATTVVRDGKKSEEREYTSFGEMKRLTSFFDNGQIFLDLRVTFNAQKLETKRVEQSFTFENESGKLRLYSEVIESTSYFKKSKRPARKTRLTSREFEKSQGVYLWQKGLEETTIFAPVGGGVEHFESRLYQPGPEDKPVEVELRIEDTTYDAQDRPVAHMGTNTNVETGEKKALRSVTTYRHITVTTTDLGADGNDDEESVIIVDDSARVVESRAGKPKFGPFTQRQELTYDDHGELIRRVRYENNSDKPVSVVIFS